MAARMRDALPDIATAALAFLAWGLLTKALASYLDARVWWISGGLLCLLLFVAAQGWRPIIDILRVGLLAWAERAKEESNNARSDGK